MTNLNAVEKPVRYVGQEWNAVTHKPSARLRFAFSYPDIYEVGMSFLGLQIMYGLLNEKEWIWCERAFAPWPDHEKQLRQAGEPLTTLESKTPLHEMDIIGFSLQHEMLYTNVLAMLDLSGIPLSTRERNENHPIIIAGGPCAFNPMPMSQFIDAFIIGEGEEVTLELCQKYLETKEHQASRHEILREFAKIEGVFVPAFYEEITNRYDERIPAKPQFDDLPHQVDKRIVQDFEYSYYPTKQIIPNTQVIHHRLALEVMRGCPGGCRFCQAGYTDRPVRERSPQRLLQDAREGLNQTGFNELGLLSLSTADYTQLPTLCGNLIQEYYPQRIALSLPSLRIDAFPSRVTQEIGKVRGTGLTFAPEAGTERLRWAINKLIYDAEIFAKVRESVSSNQGTMKFYFMVGLPTETDEDLQGIVDMILQVKQILKKEGKYRTNIHVGLSPFVPKPHTAYQWYGQISKEEIIRRVRYITSRLNKVKGVKTNWHDPDKSLLEGALSRGDTRLGPVIQRVYEEGGRFDEWQEHFLLKRWHKAFAEEGLSLEHYAQKTYERKDPLPWQMISVRIDTRYLWREWEKTFREVESRHCGNEKCRVCKVCDGQNYVTVHANDNVNLPRARYNMEHDLTPELQSQTPHTSSNGKQYRYRFRFSKTGSIIYASHHDLMMLMESIFRRAGIQLAYSEGFHPHAKIMFASALSVGIPSFGEYIDITTVEPYEAGSLLSHLNQFTPTGIQFLEAAELDHQTKKITAAVKAFHYDLRLQTSDSISTSDLNLSILQETFEDQFIRNSLEVKIPSENQIHFQYICAVQGGKFIKPDQVVEILQDTLILNLTVVQCIRKNMYALNKHNEMVSLIPHLEKNNLPYNNNETQDIASMTSIQ